MTIAAFEAQASWLPTVVGLRCAAVRTDGEQLVSLYFGELRDVGDELELDAERVITLDGAWRLEQGDSIIAASEDPDDEREEFLNELVGKELARFEVTRPGYDLALYFEDGLLVRCFPIDSLEYADDIEDPDDAEISWWVDGDGVPDDWETARAE
jgi:hypothetical protein